MSREKFRYEINEELELRIYDGENPEPFLLQPFNPDNNNQPWADKEEAEAYANKTIDEIVDLREKLAEDPDYLEKLHKKRLSDFNYPQVEGFNPTFTAEQTALIEQAKEDSERMKRIEQVVSDILKKLN